MLVPPLCPLSPVFSQGYQTTDAALIALCRDARIDYSACTSVTALVTGDLLTLAHLGDSKIVLGREVAPGECRVVVLSCLRCRSTVA